MEYLETVKNLIDIHKIDCDDYFEYLIDNPNIDQDEYLFSEELVSYLKILIKHNNEYIINSISNLIYNERFLIKKKNAAKIITYLQMVGELQ